MKLAGAGGVAVFRRAVSFEWSHEYKVTTQMLMRKVKINRMMKKMTGEAPEVRSDLI